MPVSRHFQMGVIPMENWILVNFLYRFNMLLTEAGQVERLYIQIKQCLSTFWWNGLKTKVHTLSIKLSISKFQIVKPSDVLLNIAEQLLAGR